MQQCFSVEGSQKFVYQDPELLQQLQKGQQQKDIVLSKFKQQYEGLCKNSQFVQEILPIEDNCMSRPELIYDRTGNITYQVVANCNVVYREIPELILFNCQIKEVNQKDDEIVQLICKGLGALSDTNIYVFIDNNDKAQKHFQVDQIIPALNRKTIYQVGCPVINCFAQPMGVLDNKCYYALKITENKADIKHVQHNLEIIKLLLTDLNKYSLLVRDEFLQIFSKNTVQRQATKDRKGASAETQDVVPIHTLVANILKKQPAQAKEANIVYLKLDLADLTAASAVLIQSLPPDIILAVKPDIEVLQEITKEIMFWLRFLIESCQVYNPKNINLLKTAIKQHF